MIRNTLRVANVLYPDQDQCPVGPDLDPNCLQRLFADNKCLRKQEYSESNYDFRSYSKFKKAAWETNDTYCDSIKETPLYSDHSGKLLLDIIDMHIFDFITGRNIFCVFYKFLTSVYK